jgi:hypothetical protein
MGASGSAIGPSWAIAIAITAAVVTASGSLYVGLLLESYRRYLERGALAAALLSEITSILQIFEDHDFVGVYRQLQEVFQRAAQSGAPGTDPTFRDTVYEKCADRIGMLGRDEAVGVVRFYGFLNGFRNAVRQAFNGDLPMQVRIDSLKVLNTKLFPAELPKARALQSRLETAANRRWRGWVLVGLIPVVAAIIIGGGVVWLSRRIPWLTTAAGCPST